MPLRVVVVGVWEVVTLGQMACSMEEAEAAETLEAGEDDAKQGQFCGGIFTPFFDECGCGCEPG
jgi:hypothetical protein